MKSVLLLASIISSCCYFSCKQKTRHGNITTQFLTFHFNDPYVNEMYGKGIEKSKQEEFMDANLYFLKADSALPNDHTILNALGNTATQLDSFEQARSYFSKALQIDSNFIKTYNNFGVCLNQMHHYEEAIDILTDGIVKASANTSDKRALYFNLAVSWSYINNNSLALVFLDSAKAGLTGGELYNKIIEEEDRIKN